MTHAEVIKTLAALPLYAEAAAWLLDLEERGILAPQWFDKFVGCATTAEVKRAFDKWLDGILADCFPNFVPPAE